MGERQLRSRNVYLEVEAASRDLECCGNSNELDSQITESEILETEESNTNVDEQIGNGDRQLPDNQVKSSEQSDDSNITLSKQLQIFMENVMKGFDNLNSKIQSENSVLTEKLNAKLEAENLRLAAQIESTNKRLSETLTKQFKEEIDKLRGELSCKLEADVTKVQGNMDKLRKDTAVEIVSVRQGMEGMCEKLENRLTGHIEETDQRINRITQELKVRTKGLAVDLSQQAENTDSEIQLVRQEWEQVKEQINKDVSDKIADFSSQITAEKQEYQTKITKVHQEFDKLKEKLSVKHIRGDTINSNDYNNHCQVITLSNSSQEGIGSVGSVNNNTDDQRSVNVSNACESVSNCGNIVQDVGNSVRVVDNTVHVNPQLLAACSPLNELTLPSYSNHSTQIIGNFLKDLDLYFTLKAVPENLKLPLAARGVQDPFTKTWLSAEYHKLGTYENFKTQITQLLWNDQKQSSIRCKIFQDKYNKNGEETLAAHYLRYVNLAANLQPPLSEYDLIGALTAHYPYEVQKCMISANLKSNQEALALLGKLQAMDEEWKTNKDKSMENKPRDFRKRENKPPGNNREDNRREYYQDVRHVTYDRRQNRYPRSPYNQNTTRRNQQQSHSGRNWGSSPDRRPLDPQVPEFNPTGRIHRSNAGQEQSNASGHELQNLEN